MRRVMAIIIGLTVLTTPFPGHAASANPASAAQAKAMRERRTQRRNERRGIVTTPKRRVRTPVTRPVITKPSTRRRAERVPGTPDIAVTHTRRLFTLINDIRQDNGLPPFNRVRELDIAAQRHAEDMAERNYFSHETPEGKLFDRRIRAAGYGDGSAMECRCTYLTSFGENIAKGQRTPEETVKAWMNSPPHRKNILSEDFDDVGYGFMGDVWVQDFGRVRETPSQSPANPVQ